MSLTENGLYRKRNLAGIIWGYDIPATHPLAVGAMQFTPSNGGWHFVFEVNVKLKSFTDAELAAEYFAQQMVVVRAVDRAYPNDTSEEVEVEAARLEVLERAVFAPDYMEKE